jgi:hypothetical protein
VAGVEPWQALMTVAAILLALAGIGFFLLARASFGAPAGVALAAMAVAVLDRRVFHLALHPYYNQLWGMLTLPFTLVAAHTYAVSPSRRALAMFVAFAAVGAFAYPLMLPFPLLLAVPILGVIEKVRVAVELLWNPGNSLIGWQGDLQHYPPVGEFFAVFPNPASGVMTLAVGVLAFAGLMRAPRTLGRPLAAVLAAALAFAVYFRVVRYGQYFYFKVLSFAGPQLLTAAVVGLGAAALQARRAAARPLGFAAIVALCASALLSARSEIATSYDQLSPETIELRQWAAALPAGASIRLDTPRSSQLWQAYMLSSHPLGSRDPITNYPHVPVSAGADFALDQPLLPPPPDAVGPPLRRNEELRLWRLRSRAPDLTSRRMVPIFSGNRPATSVR